MIKQRRKTIPLSDIVIPKAFKETRPDTFKVIDKSIKYNAGCKIPEIRVDRNNVLFDGYITYLIMLHCGEVKARCIVEWESKSRRRKEGRKDEMRGTQQNADG